MKYFIKQKKLNPHIFAVLIIILFTIIRVYYFSESNREIDYLLPRVLDNAFVYSKIVQFDNNSIMSIYFNNSWTMLTQVVALFLHFKFNLFLITCILNILPQIFYYFGSYLISIELTNKVYLSIIISFTIILFNLNYPSFDYPILWITPHTFGAFGLSLSSLLIGLIVSRYFLMSGIILAFLISIHLIYGIYFLFLITINLILVYNKHSIPSLLSLLKGFLIFSPILIISFLFFPHNLFQANDLVNYSSFDDYMKYWEAHRNRLGLDRNFLIYMFISITSLFYFIKVNSNKNLIFLLLISILGIIFYITKFYSSQFLFIQRLMIIRFTIITNVPMLTCLLSILFSSFLFNKVKYFTFSLFIIFILQLFNLNYKKIINLSSINNFKNKSYQENLFWLKINSIRGNILTTYSTTRPTLIFGKKPYILDVTSFDFIPNFPYAADKLNNIITNVYGLNFKLPPKKSYRNAEIYDESIKIIFESRSKLEWDNLSKLYNFNLIVVPNNFNLKLNVFFTCEKYTAYYSNSYISKIIK